MALSTTLPPLDQLPARLEIIRTLLAEKSLYEFLKQAWPHFDPSKFMGNWHIGAIAEHLEAVNNGQIKRLLINIPPRHCKTAMVSVAWPLWTWIQKQDPAMPLRGPGVRFLCAAYGAGKAQQDGVTSRRLIDSVWFQQRWGRMWQIEKTRDNMEQFDNTLGGYRISTGIPESLGKGGSIRICDDIHKVDEVESKLVIASQIRAYNEIWRTRSNDPKYGAEVIIGQRLGEDDIFGYLLSKEEDFVHLCLPERYESGRHCETEIGFSDPRTEDGQLLWPERFGEQWAREQEASIGAFAWCNPAEAPVLMGDLTLRPIGEVKQGDRIIGFVGPQGERRSTLVTSEVLAISRSVRPVVKMTLDSGAVIRCTPDHRWYTARFPSVAEPHRKTYAPATIGTPLMRVCPPALKVLEDPEDIWAAGWLAGFFDGEGSISLGVKKDVQYANRPAAIIAFTQNTGTNLNLCEKLEETLKRFGLEYSTWEKARPRLDPNQANWQRCRIYYLRVGRYRLPVSMFLLHVIKISKWRDRLIEASLRTTFVTDEERVVLIEPDGEEEVFGLTTSTGNYIVWGLASSNSGQFQQRPEPRGGGIIKRAWWRLFGPDDPVASGVRFPPFSFVLASLDTAYTAKEANDPSALVIMGVWTNVETGYQNVMLVYAWEAHLELPDLVRRVKYTCDKYRIDRLLIENKAAGHPVEQELTRMLSRENWGITFTNPGRSSSGGRQDKEARLHSISHLFEEGMVHRPNTQWAVAVEDQVSIFPRAQRDDYVDCLSAGLRWLRDNGLLHRKVEQRAIETELEQYRGGRATSRPLYAA